MNAKEIIAWNLRHHRVLAGLSQERLALEAGIDRAYVGRIERGLENVTIERVQSLADVVGVTVAELLTAPPTDAGPPARLRAGRKPAKTQGVVEK